MISPIRNISFLGNYPINKEVSKSKVSVVENTENQEKKPRNISTELAATRLYEVMLTLPSSEEAKYRKTAVPIIWQVVEYDKPEVVEFNIINLNEGLNEDKKKALKIFNDAVFGKDENCELDDNDYEALRATLASAIGEGYSNFDYGNTVFAKKLLDCYPQVGEENAKLIARLFNSSNKLDINKQKIQGQNDDIYTLIAVLQRESMLPAIVYKMTKESCKSEMEILKENQKIEGKRFDLTTESEKEKIKEVIEALKNEGLEIEDEDMEMLMCGFAMKHPKTCVAYKRVIKELLAKDLVKVLISTPIIEKNSTIKAKTVVFKEMPGIGNNTILQQSGFNKMVERAGREGDDFANAILYGLNGLKDSELKSAYNYIQNYLHS